MRFLAVILLIAGSAAHHAIAGDPARDPQTAAAASDARETLRRQVLAANVARGLTVRELLDNVGGADELAKRLQAAQQIGGTRWLDDQTVQVRLMIDGGAVAQ